MHVNVSVTITVTVQVKHGITKSNTVAEIEEQAKDGARELVAAGCLHATLSTLCHPKFVGMREHDRPQLLGEPTFQSWGKMEIVP